MTQAPSAAKKAKSSPPLGELDAVTRGAPENQGRRGDPHPEEPNYWIAIRLALMLLFCLMPFAVLLFVVKNNIEHYVSRDISAIFAACWAIFALWITLHKGRVEDVSGPAWLLLGLFNLLAVLGTFFLAGIS
jgi:hypothetical protein